MSTQVQNRRGSASEIAAFTPAVAEVVVNTDDYTLVVGNGTKAGGINPNQNDLSQVWVFPTVALYKSSTILFPAGKTIHLNDRNADFTVINGTGTANTLNIIASDNVAQSIDLKTNSDGVFTPKQAGAVGNGVINDTPVFTILESLFESYPVNDGTYLLANITLNSELVFAQGGIIKSRTADVIISRQIQAGDYKVFDTGQDFYSALPASFIVNPFIRLKGQERVMVDWFGNGRVQDKDLIKSVPNATKFIGQAFRAATGAYIIGATNFIGETTNQNVGLATGSYNIESMVRWSIVNAGSVYSTSGTGITGNGVASSFLVASELKFGFGQPVVQISNFTGQINQFKDFKAEVYAPQEGANKFLGEFAAVLWFSSGDSMQLNNVWAAGAQVGVDEGEGFLRNGVGIQFYSVVDVQGSNVFSENNLYNYGIYSAPVSIANMVSFGSKEAAVIFGLPAENFTYPQGVSKSQLNVTGGDIHNCRNECILSIEPGAMMYATGFRANGTPEGGGTAIGRNFGLAINSADLSGAITGAFISDFVKSLARAEDAASLGSPVTNLAFDGGRLERVTTVTTTGQPGVVSTAASSSNDHFVRVANYSLDNVVPQLVNGKGNMTLTNISLRSFRGLSDSGVDRQLYQWTAGSLKLTNITRTDNNSQTISQYGFSSGGKVRIDINATDLAGVTRGKSGSGTVEMPDIVAFS